MLMASVGSDPDEGYVYLMTDIGQMKLTISEALELMSDLLFHIHRALDADAGWP